MAKAIREGRFSIEELLGSIRNSKDTILAASEDTRTFGESMQILKNKVELALQPLGSAMSKAMKDLLPLFESAVGLLANVANKFNELDPTIKRIVGAIVLFGGALATGKLAIGGLSLALSGSSGLGAILSSLGLSFGGLSGAIAFLTGPIGIAIAAIVAIGAALVIAYKQSEDFRKIVQDIAAFIADAFKQAWDAIKSFAAAAWPVLVGLWNEYKDTVVKALQPVIQVWNEHKDLILKILGAIALGLTGPIGAIILFATKFKDSFEQIKAVLSNFSGFFEQVWDNFITVVKTVWTTVTNIIAAAVKLISSITKAASGDWSGAWEDYKSAADFAWKAILAIVQGSVELMLGILKAAWEAIKGVAPPRGRD